jgi:hypothetical protein
MDNKNSKTLNSTEISGNSAESKGRFVLQKKNYLLIIVGFAMMITGFILMSGGGSDDPAVFSDELFSFRRITLAPIIILLGIVIEIIAIMWIPKKQ